MSREELFSILPNIMMYNRKLVASNNGLDLIDVHDLVVKIYWIFIISIYATYFIDYDDENNYKMEAFGDDKVKNLENTNEIKNKSLILNALELSNNDIKVNAEKIMGNTDDTKFLEFLDKVKSLSPYNNDVESNFEIGVSSNNSEMQKKINEILNIQNNYDIPPPCDNIPPPIIPSIEEQFQDPELTLSNAAEDQPKKSCKEKFKKCCLDHCEMDDHYKESHSSKKRLKKDCNHARMNETRDRLRKKLSQIVNARKNSNTVQTPPVPHTSTNLASNTSESNNPMDFVPNAEVFPSYLQQQKPPTWDEVHEIVYAFERFHNEAKRNENLQNLCECLQHLQTNSKSETKTCNNIGNKKVQHNHQKKMDHQQLLNDNQPPPQNIHSLEPPNKRSNFSDNSVTEAAISNQTTKIKDNKPTTTSNPSTKSGNDLNFVSEICEIIDSYSKEQTKRSSNENLHNLCECLQQLQTNPKSDSKTQSNKSIKNVHQNNYQNQQKVQEQHQTDINQYPANRSCSSLEPPNKKSNLSNTSTRDASTSSQGTKSKDNNSSNTTIPTPISSSKTTNNLDFVSEICEIIDNYSKEQAKRRWIKETLSFIEGPTAGTGKKKTQPQTLNPKKAAKKAKQKQRKEEEKRIAELQDLRAQFHNIYFKEFSEKLNLKSLKANKKRDKKKIAEVESNIKNLQRAKAKVETAILELIATVKQTNSEFKFSYLPTKEQQLEKLRELESHDVGKNTDKTIKVRNLLHHTTKDSNTVTPTLSSPFTMTPTNNLNMVPESYSMPYAHANHFPYNLGFPTPVASAPFGLMRATPMCYAPPPATALAAAEEQRSLAPDVVAAMASNAATNNTTDPSKRIVTIRRVNLPNVPEPQVTVTAKGSSPDKDKLLYTFINGQLIQTGTAPPINIPQMSAISPLNNQQKQTSTLNSETSSRTHASKLAVENLLTIPPPPPPKLSKTQMKKERKRLAKLQVESSEKVECIRIEKDQREFHQEQKQPKKKKTIMASDQRAKVTCCQSSKEVLNNKNKNKNKLCNSNSTTSVSTNENNESPQLPQMLALKNSAKQKRSDSTTTSCSAVTSPSSNNSTSSQMNTRDNSLSSLKPVDSKPSKNKRSGYVNEPKCNALSKVNTANENKTKSVQQKHNKKQNRISVTPSTTSSETEYDEEEISENKENKLTSASMPQTKKVQLSHTTKLSGINKQKTQSQKTKHIKKPVTLSTSNPESEEEIVQRNHKKRRPKLVDNGQFDNNPFKSLHMQDSETNWSSEEEVDNEEESGNEIDCKRKSALEEKIVMQKSDHKDKHGDESKTSKLNQKSKKNKTQNVSTTPVTENANITSKTSKNNKNTNYQQQIKGSDHPKINNVKNQNRIHDGENRGNSQTRLQRQNMQQNCNSNVRNSKAEIGSKIKTNNKQQTNSSKSHSHTPASSNINNTNSSSSTNNKSQTRNNTRQHSNNNRSTNFSQKITIEQSQHTFQPNNLQSFPSGITENKNQPPKRSQRNKKYQLKSHKHSVNMHHQSCSSSGIPNHMGYFNINEVNIEGAQVQQSPINNSNNNSNQNSTYQSLAEQMQALRLSGGPQVQSNDATPSAQQRHQHINTANVSIMDQLNRGVQVENLSLPPGITLTKVDPIKSEQLRQKSESIKKLAKPLQSQSHLSQNSQAFHHSSMAGSTIIAPPIVNSMASYYGSPYVTATAGIDPQSGIIMVEANPPKNSNVSNKKVTQSTGACNGKQSKNKKRRNKSKAKNLASCPTINSGNNENSKQEVNMGNGQPKMITLRNPMFHNGPTTAPTALLQPQVILPGRPVDGFPIPTPLPVDQPAAIIKNENGMYTIRNPALHQAVTSGLAMGGYRQFGGNVSYYTPQEAAAEAARATRQQQQQQQRHEDNKSSTSLGNTNSSSFSYFSNDVIQANMSHNNINISCTSIGGGDTNAQNHACVNTVGGLSGDAAVIQRPTPQQRPISAIGSEIKNAQQQKQKTITEQQQWTNFGSDTLPLNKNDNLNTSFLGAVTDSASTVVAGSGDMNLQEKYQQSKYYNGFEVFTGSSGGSSSSAATCAHIHHNCGDDSPPPSITGYNSYLEGIPNTGVIRYDDASFLKNLIPGQNLNNEVSIHNVNESNFTRNAQSPTTHHVEITPVYGNRPSSASLYESPAGQTNNANYRGNYRDSLNDYNCGR
ncbi:hypothetical protein DOY81_006056 [Sarcophaga bullata]|nr:hypothetical protein DOY81_006056 [Sarcophaga bullata]